MPEKNKNQLNIDYEVDFRNVKYPRLEYKTGNLILILPKENKDETKILEKHRKWITRKEATIKQAVEEAKKKTLNQDRTDKELRQLVHSTVNKYEKETRPQAILGTLLFGARDRTVNLTIDLAYF